jgi:hypothetical protein
MLWTYREGRTIFILLRPPVFIAFAAFSLSSAVGFAAAGKRLIQLVGG